ncbi:cold-regulated 413 plasma membrane protein 2-like [Lycium ferocissimum]|uniref:cold-regulated 413 plasma membrane protein 2-like n=1 Tax=Lycium ferocissimum TaxID=112874 RepID=UPI002815CDC6|nr:cold-regulated 413 plasma membrane protein 2-like [Lycium ferocissimum]
MGMKKSYLAMKTDAAVASDLIESDFKEIGVAARKLANHAIMLGGLGFGTSFLKWMASFAAVYLLILDRTNWRTNMLTSLLIPYIFLTLPSILFNLFRGDVGKWLSVIAVVTRLFFPKHFPDWLEAPAALVLLMVVAPSFFADTARGSWIGILICLVIGCYLLQEHIRASGGFRNAFTKANGVSNTIGIVLVMVYPVWALILFIL